MKKRFFFLAVLFIFLLQLTFFDKLKLFNIKPDLLLAVSVLSALSFQLKWALISAVFCGFLKDIAGTDFFSLNIMLFSFWAYISLRISRKVAIENTAFFAVFIFFISLANAALSRLILALLAGGQIPLTIFLRVAFLESLYTCTSSFLLVYALKPWLEPKL